MIQSSSAAQRIGPDESNPGGWLLRGESFAFHQNSIWAAIQASLEEDRWAGCIRCEAVTLTRGEVMDAVNRIPWRPHYRRVGLHMPRCLASVLLTLAIWKNGGAYVPLAADYPPERVRVIAAACDLNLIIADRRLNLPEYLCIEADASVGPVLFFHTRDRTSLREAADDNLCYIAHTSGSSGTPKGVKISHANLLNRIGSMQLFLDVKPQDRILYKTSAVFDVHVWEFTLPLVAGCLLIIYPQTTHFDLFEVAGIIVAGGVTIVGFVPALLRLLLNIPTFTENNALRCVLCGGESWTPALGRLFYSKLPNRRLFNSYGPTETTIAVANWPVPDRPDLQKIDLGSPLHNLTFFIEEDTIEAPSPAEYLIGSLSIAGAQVALGYIDERGKSRFFHRVIEGQSVRFYRTGDTVRLNLMTGSLQFKGREDRQVKVNGVRIELEEIEEAVSSVSDVEGCIAFVVDVGKGSQMCAVYKCKGNIPISVTDIKQACVRLLPAIHVPARFQQVGNFPLSENGKVDRASLIARFTLKPKIAPSK